MRPDDQPLERMLRCLKCGRTNDHPPDELLGFTKAGWPRCCGEVMELVNRRKRPRRKPKR
jgi:hypothetical protein